MQSLAAPAADFKHQIAPHRTEWLPPEPLQEYIYQEHLGVRANHLGRRLRYTGFTMNQGPWSGWIMWPVEKIAKVLAAERTGDLERRLSADPSA
jgi:hypothetical protein